MKYSIALLCASLFAANAMAQTAVEKADQRLEALLAPGSGVPHVSFTTQPIGWKPTKMETEISTAMKPFAGVPVRLPLPAGAAVKPRSAPEGTPLVSYVDTTNKPKEIELPTKPLVRLPSLDTNTPIPIPILATPMKDRASLGDPAFDVSVAAALTRFDASRKGPVPFAPLNLPDPFEHMRFGQMRNPPEENATPMAMPLSKPTK